MLMGPLTPQWSTAVVCLWHTSALCSSPPRESLGLWAAQHDVHHKSLVRSKTQTHFLLEKFRSLQGQPDHSYLKPQKWLWLRHSVWKWILEPYFKKYCIQLYGFLEVFAFTRRDFGNYWRSWWGLQMWRRRFPFYRAPHMKCMKK